MEPLLLIYTNSIFFSKTIVFLNYMGWICGICFVFQETSLILLLNTFFFQSSGLRKYIFTKATSKYKQQTYCWHFRFHICSTENIIIMFCYFVSNIITWSSDEKWFYHMVSWNTSSYVKFLAYWVQTATLRYWFSSNQ